MKKKIYLTAYLVLIMVTLLNAQTQIIAHRGYWDKEGSAQNSLAALKEAASLGVYGSEFDVLITQDGVAVVNHDDEINGFVIKNTNYEQIKNFRIKNGETLPILEHYLETGKKLPAIKLILEIKPHSTKEKEDKAVEIITSLVKKYEIENQVEYISFSLNICKQILKACPDAPVSYLNGDLTPQQIKQAGLSGIDYHFKLLQENPQWIKECKELGLSTNTWTVNDPDVIDFFCKEGIDYITTDTPFVKCP